MRLGPPDKASVVRQKWLSGELEQPISRLLESFDQADMLASWPDHIPAELNHDEWLQLHRLLVKLRSFATELRDTLEARAADSSTINAELRFDLVSQLADACRDAGIPIVRSYHSGKGNLSPVAEIIQLACSTICGSAFPIDHQLRDYLKLAQAKKRSSR